MGTWSYENFSGSFIYRHFDWVFRNGQIGGGKIGIVVRGDILVVEKLTVGGK